MTDKKSEGVKKEETTTDEAKALIAKKNAEDIAACTEGLKALLEEHGCDFNITMTISPRGNQPNIQIIKK